MWKLVSKTGRVGRAVEEGSQAEGVPDERSSSGTERIQRFLIRFRSRVALSPATFDPCWLSAEPGHIYLVWLSCVSTCLCHGGSGGDVNPSAQNCHVSVATQLVGIGPTHDRVRSDLQTDGSVSNS